MIKAHKIRLYSTLEQAHYFARAAGTLIKVDRFFPSSQLCHACGGMRTDLTLADREYACPLCGYVGDRDENASWNILQEALRLVGA